MTQKFEITISDHAKRRIKIRGFDRIEDACAAALGLARVQPAEHYVSVWCAKRRHHANESLVTTRSTYRDELPAVIESARRALAIVEDKRRKSDERHAWLNQYPHKAFDCLLANDPAREAWAKNDFVTAGKCLAENGFVPRAEAA